MDEGQDYEFLNGLPVHKPSWIRTIQLWDKTIRLAVLNGEQFYVPVQTVGKMFNIEADLEVSRMSSGNGYFSRVTLLIRMPLENPDETLPVMCINLSAIPFLLSTVDLSKINDDNIRNTLTYIQLRTHGILAEHYRIDKLDKITTKYNDLEETVYNIGQIHPSDDPDMMPF